MDLGKLRLKGTNHADITITTEDGTAVQGINRAEILLEPNFPPKLKLEVYLYEGTLDISAMSDLQLKDEDLVKELRSRGYLVQVDDSDIQEELEQNEL